MRSARRSTFAASSGPTRGSSGSIPKRSVAAFNAATEPPPAERTAEAPKPRARSRPSPRGSLLLWIAASVAVLLVAFVVYNELTMRRERAPVATASIARRRLPRPR